MESVASRIANWLIENGAKESEREVYAYGIECFLNVAITFGTILAIAAAMGKVGITLVWFAFFLPLRHTSGGLHASSRIGCFILSLAVGVGCMLLNAVVVGHTWFIVVGAVFSLIVVFVCAPVIHPNHPVPERQIKNIMRASRSIIVIEIALMLLFQVCHFQSVAAAAILGVLSASISTFIGRLKAA